MFLHAPTHKRPRPPARKGRTRIEFYLARAYKKYAIALVGRAETAERAGLDGIVCSPLDLELLQGRAKKLLRIVPGIRTKKVSTEDQTRVATAADAAKAGASYIVVGRPILEAADPIAAAKDILKTLEEASR